MAGKSFLRSPSRWHKRRRATEPEEQRKTPSHLLEMYRELLDAAETSIEDYLEHHVVENEEGDRVAFELRAFQRRLIDVILDCWANNRAAYIIIIKARQLGFSTLIEMLLEEGFSRHKGCKGLTVAHDKDATEALFEKVSYAADQIPDDVRAWNGSIKRRASGTRISFKNHDLLENGRHSRSYQLSGCRVMTARKKQGARSGTFQRMHLSEFAHWEDLSRLDAYQQSVHDRAGNFLIIETTAFGRNAAYDVWKAAEEGRGDYIPFFVAWWEHEPYSRPFANARERAEFIASIGKKDPFRYGGQEEADLLEGRIGYTLRGVSYGYKPLTPEQLHWRRYWIENKCKGSLKLFHQEMPAFPEQAFSSSGLPVFNVGRLKEWEPYAIGCEMNYPVGRFEWDPDFLSFTGATGNYQACPVKFAEDFLGGWTIFKAPEQGMRCVIGSDVAEGLESLKGGGETDFSTAYVIDADTGQRLARFRARCEPGEFYMELFKASRAYGDAWTLIEANGPGLAVIKLLERERFHRLLTRPRVEKTAEGKSTNEMRPGFLTTRRSKPHLISYLQRWTDNAISPPSGLPHDAWSPFDQLLLDEMLTFVKSGMGKMGAEGGKHDDLVIAAALAELAREETPEEALTEVGPDQGELVRFLGRAAMHPDAEEYEDESQIEGLFEEAYGE